MDTDGKRLAVSLSTLDLEPTGEGTTLRLTVQIAAMVGRGLIEAFESGNKGALENLARHLTENP